MPWPTRLLGTGRGFDEVSFHKLSHLEAKARMNIASTVSRYASLALSSCLVLALGPNQDAIAQRELVDGGDFEAFQFFAPYAGFPVGQFPEPPGLVDSTGTSYDAIGYDVPIGDGWGFFGLGPDDPSFDDTVSFTEFDGVTYDAADVDDAFQFDSSNGWCPECTFTQETTTVASGVSSGRFFSPATNDLAYADFFGEGSGFSFPGTSYTIFDQTLFQPGHDLTFSLDMQDDVDLTADSGANGLDIIVRFESVGFVTDETDPVNGGFNVTEELGVLQLVSSDISNIAFSKFSTTATVPANVSQEIDDGLGGTTTAISDGPPTSITATVFFFGLGFSPAYNLYIDNFSIVNEDLAPVFEGDYNGDGVVDAADYTVWRDALASGGTLMNESATLGVVDPADYDEWAASYGAVQSPPAISIPEPIAAASFGVALLVVSGARSRRPIGRSTAPIRSPEPQRVL